MRSTQPCLASSLLRTDALMNCGRAPTTVTIFIRPISPSLRIATRRSQPLAPTLTAPDRLEGKELHGRPAPNAENVLLLREGYDEHPVCVAAPDSRSSSARLQLPTAPSPYRARRCARCTDGTHAVRRHGRPAPLFVVHL